MTQPLKPVTFRELYGESRDPESASVYFFDDQINDAAHMIVHRPGCTPSCAMFVTREGALNFMIDWARIEPSARVYRFEYRDGNSGEQVYNEQGHEAVRLDTAPCKEPLMKQPGGM